MPPAVHWVSSSSEAQTTRHWCPPATRCWSQTRLLRVEPPRAGAYDALEVKSIRIPDMSGQAVGSGQGHARILGLQQLLHFLVGQRFDLLIQGLVPNGVAPLIRFDLVSKLA